MNEAAVAAALGLSLLELYQLMRNGQFPQPVAGLWSPGAISAFGALMTAATANWPSLGSGNYASANWATLATTSPGPYRPSPGGLMGGANTRGVYGSGAAPSGVYGPGSLFD